jgi:alpha-L-fucosidase
MTFAQTVLSKYGSTSNVRQMKYYNAPLAGFIHFGMNTFTNKEWGDGSETVTNFNPTICSW